MKRSKRRSRQEWEKLIGDQKQSGLSAKDFCKGKSIELGCFYQGRRRLRDNSSGLAGGIKSRDSFIDIGQIASSGGSTMVGANPWVVTLDLGEGFKLTLQRG